VAKHFRPGVAPKARELNDIAERADQRVIGGDGTSATQLPGSLAITSESPEVIDASLLGTSGTGTGGDACYAWEEVYFDADSLSWEAAADGRSGDLTTLSAKESSGLDTLAAGTKVELTLDDSGEWYWFDAPASAVSATVPEADYTTTGTVNLVPQSLGRGTKIVKDEPSYALESTVVPSLVTLQTTTPQLENFIDPLDDAEYFTAYVGPFVEVLLDTDNGEGPLTGVSPATRSRLYGSALFLFPAGEPFTTTGQQYPASGNRVSLFPSASATVLDYPYGIGFGFGNGLPTNTFYGGDEIGAYWYGRPGDPAEEGEPEGAAISEFWLAGSNHYASEPAYCIDRYGDGASGLFIGQWDTVAGLTFSGGLYTGGAFALADGAVTSAKLASGAVTDAAITDNTISGGKIADETISGDKILDSTVVASRLAFTTVEVVSVPGSSASPGSANQIATDSTYLYFHNGTQWLRVAGSTF
jgi:hypothetical protein